MDKVEVVVLAPFACCGTVVVVMAVVIVVVLLAPFVRSGGRHGGRGRSGRASSVCAL